MKAILAQQTLQTFLLSVYRLLFLDAAAARPLAMLYRYKKVGLASPILGGGGGPPSSVWTRAPTVREIVIGLASFFFACLLFRDPQNPTYEYYANLPKQIIYRWKGLPAGPVKTLLVFGDSVSACAEHLAGS